MADVRTQAACHFKSGFCICHILRLFSCRNDEALLVETILFFEICGMKHMVCDMMQSALCIHMYLCSKYNSIRGSIGERESDILRRAFVYNQENMAGRYFMHKKRKTVRW